jgi:hypothetical protein
MGEVNKSNVSRRGLVAAGAATIAAAPVLAAGGVGIGRMLSRPPESWSYSEWRGYVGSSFKLLGENGWVTARLDSVQSAANVGKRPRDLARAFGFTARFSTPLSAAPAGNATYELSQGALSAGSLFLVRRADTDKAAQLAAFFN